MFNITQRRLCISREYQLFIPIFLLIVSYILAGFNLSIFAESNYNTLYWLKRGVYFKYSVEVYTYSIIGRKGDWPVFARTYYDHIIFHNKSSEKMDRYYIKTDDITVFWRINDIINNSYIEVEYIVEMDNAIFLQEFDPLKILRGDFDKNQTTNITIKSIYLVNLDTLDTYSINGNSWVGEWFFLLQPRLTIEEGIKYHSVSPGNLSINLPYSEDTMTEILSYIKLINDTVYNFSNGEKTYFPLKDIDLYEKTKTISFIISNTIANFFFVHPPPFKIDYNYGNIYLEKNRLCGYFSSFYAYATTLFEEYYGSFQTLYNASNRRMAFFKFPSFLDESDYYIFMIDPKADVHWLWIYPANVTYDSITGTLLLFEGGPEVSQVLFPFNDLSEKYYVGIMQGGGIASIKLIETNLDFSRPTFGKEEQDTLLTNNATRRENEKNKDVFNTKLFDLENPILIFSAAIIIVSVIMLMKYMKTRRS